MKCVRKQISDAQPGSDIYGLREKIAYHYYLINPSRSAEANWFRAERDLESWCLFQLGNSKEFKEPIESSFHELLQRRAYHQHRGLFREAGSSFDEWIYAQTILAEQIIHQVNNF